MKRVRAMVTDIIKTSGKYRLKVIYKDGWKIMHKIAWTDTPVKIGDYIQVMIWGDL